MNQLIILYGAIIAFTLLNWAWTLTVLYKGLDHTFLKVREAPQFTFFFERYKYIYIQNMIGTVLYFIIFGFAVYRLLSILGLWLPETAFFTSCIWQVWAKDRLQYVTALFVVRRMTEQPRRKVEQPQ